MRLSSLYSGVYSKIIVWVCWLMCSSQRVTSAAPPLGQFLSFDFMGAIFLSEFGRLFKGLFWVHDLIFSEIGRVFQNFVWVCWLIYCVQRVPAAAPSLGQHFYFFLRGECGILKVWIRECIPDYSLSILANILLSKVPPGPMFLFLFSFLGLYFLSEFGRVSQMISLSLLVYMLLLLAMFLF
jgi:hypothetical protein